MCGPSQQQQSLGASETSFANLLQANYSQNFGAQSQVFQNLNNIFTPIAQAGPDQQGWGPQEAAAVNTQIGEGVGSNYAKATQALNTQLSARGGGNEYLPTGSEAALQGGVAAAAANQQSSEQLGATEANYAQGRQNWQQATAGLNALGQEYNPNAIAGEGNQANQSAFGQATKIQDMKNQEQASIAGGIAGLAMAPFTGGTSLFGAGVGALKNSFSGSSGGIGGLGAGGVDEYGQYS